MEPSIISRPLAPWLVNTQQHDHRNPRGCGFRLRQQLCTYCLRVQDAYYLMPQAHERPSDLRSQPVLWRSRLYRKLFKGLGSIGSEVGSRRILKSAGHLLHGVVQSRLSPELRLMGLPKFLRVTKIRCKVTPGTGWCGTVSQCAPRYYTEVDALVVKPYAPSMHVAENNELVRTTTGAVRSTVTLFPVGDRWSCLTIALRVLVGQRWIAAEDLVDRHRLPCSLHDPQSITASVDVLGISNSWLRRRRGEGYLCAIGHRHHDALVKAQQCHSERISRCCTQWFWLFNCVVFDSHGCGGVNPARIPLQSSGTLYNIRHVPLHVCATGRQPWSNSIASSKPTDSDASILRQLLRG